MNSSLYYIKSKIKRLLFSFEYLPRWVVFFMDIFLTIFSSEVSYLIVRSLRVKFYDTLDVPTRYGIVVLVNIIFFVIFKTYSGIIRYSTFIDGVKLLYATLCALFTLIIINYSTYFLI